MGVEEAAPGGRVAEQLSERDESGPGQQLGEPVHRPAPGGRHLVVEADRIRSVGPEKGDQEQAPWYQDTRLLGEQCGHFPRWGVDHRVVGQHAAESAVLGRQGS